MKTFTGKHVGILSGLVIILLILNAMTFYSSSEASVDNSSNEIILKDSKGTVRYRLYIDEYGSISEQIKDEQGRTRISRTVRKCGSVNALYGGVDRSDNQKGVEINVRVKDDSSSFRPDYNPALDLQPEAIGVVEEASVTIQSDNIDYPVYLVSSEMLGAKGYFGDPRKKLILVGANTGKTGVSIVDHKIFRAEMAQMEAGTVLAVADKKGLVTFGSAVIDASNDTKHFVKKKPYEEAWDIISNAMTLYSILNIK